MTANAKNLSTLANVLDDGTSGQILQSTGSGGVVFANIAAGASVYDSAALLPLAGNDAGDMAYVNSTNRFYINNGSGWYSISLVNTSPNITSVQDAAAGTTPFTLTTDGTATVITITANDPEDVPLTYGYSVTAGSLTNGGGTTATVAQSDNVFTVTPSTTEAYAGTFSLTFTASDGINTATSGANSFTLEFITTVTNSNYTTLLATATPKNTTVYRYFKFVPQAMRSATPDAMQYSEFELTDGTSYYSPSSASQLYRADDTDGDDYVAGQNVAASIDGNTSTKLYNGGWASKYYLYDMGSSFSTALTGWRYKTGDDMDSRDPISWTLLGSTNNSDWVLLDQRVNETITTSRQTATQDFTFNATNQAFFNAANSNYPITVTGDAHAGTFSPHRSGGYSWDFDGSTSNDSSTSRITATPSSTLSLGTGDYTVEMWVKSRSSTSIQSNGNYRLFEVANSSGGERIAIRDNGYGDSRFSVMENGSQLYRTSSGTNPYTGEWEWIQIIRDNGATKAYVNGSERGSASSTTDISGINKIYIGSAGSSGIGYGFNGNIRDFRISNIARSTTVPTEPLESDSNTLILACNKGHLLDQGPNSIPLTLSSSSNKSDPVSSTSSPYDYDEYSATDHGGSMYFDGTGDYLTLGSGAVTIPSGDFTVEAWAYPTGTTSGANSGTVLCFGANNGIGLRIFWDVNGNHFRFLITGGAATGAYIYDTNIETATPNAWYHVAAVRTSGTFKFYVNGVLQGTGTNSVTFDQSAFNLARIGYNTQNAYYWNGYISDVRYNNNTALYTSNDETANVPTAPLSSTGVELHLKGTDASIIDKAQGSNLKLVGNTTGSTTQVKFADTKSMYFDGTGDGIVVPHNDNLNLNSCNWTIEYWFNVTNPGAIANWTFLQKGDNTTVRPYAISLRLDNNNGVEPRIFPSADNSTQGQISNNAWQTFNAWHHVAFVRVNSTGVITRYINGIANGTVTSDIATNTEDLYIGNVPSAADEEGYIQDLRITKGLARYTANFTPPTASLEG